MLVVVLKALLETINQHDKFRVFPVTGDTLRNIIMSLFETEDEWDEDWFEKAVDEHIEKWEKDNELRKQSGFENKSDEEWNLEKKRLKEEKEIQEYFSQEQSSNLNNSQNTHKVIVVKKKDINKK
jgi:hypothetical protein